MSLPERDDFFERFAKKLDTEMPFQQFPQEWERVAAQLEGKKGFNRLHWLLLLLLLVSNAGWYAAYRHSRVQLQHPSQQNIMQVRPAQPDMGAAAVPQTRSDAENPMPVLPPAAPLPKIASNLSFPEKTADYLGTVASNPAPLPDTTSLWAISDAQSKQIGPAALWPLPPRLQLSFKRQTDAYLIRNPTLGIKDGKQETENRSRWSLEPNTGYSMLIDSSLRAPDYSVGLSLSYRFAGNFALRAGLARRHWRFGLDDPTAPIVDAENPVCHGCVLDTVLIDRKQWSVELSLLYEKEIVSRLALRAGAGYTFVPWIKQTDYFRYFSLYGVPPLIVSESRAAVPRLHMLNLQAGMVYPSRSRLAAVLSAQYDLPLLSGQSKWWSIHAGWRLAF